MVRLLLVPILLACAICIGVAAAVWREFTHMPARTPVRDQKTIGTDIDAQRRLADCYRDGCLEHRTSPILGCAWRLVIVEETHLADDASKAARDCGALTDKDRVAAEQVRDTLLKQVHMTGKAHL